VTAEGQPNFALSMTPANAGGPALPITQTFTVGFANQGPGFSYDGVFGVKMPGGVTVAMTDGAVNGSDVTWQHASISGAPAHAGDPASDGSHMMDLTFAAAGDYAFDVSLQYRVGTSTLTTKQTFTIHVGIDSDGDGVPDDIDPDPNDPNVCGDADGDGCDDCAASCDGPGGKDSGCCDTGATPAGPSVLAFLVVMLLARRRRVR